MNDLEKYFVFVMVAWRLTHLISAEDGPFDIIIKIRKAAGHGFWGQLMDCFYCLSVWVGLACASYTGNRWTEVIILALYYSGVSLLLEKLTNKNFV